MTDPRTKNIRIQNTDKKTGVNVLSEGNEKDKLVEKSAESKAVSVT
jgi:hypothetical protein